MQGQLTISNQPQSLWNFIFNLKHISLKELVSQIKLLNGNLTLNCKYHQHRSGDRTHNFVTPSVSDRNKLLSLSQPLSPNTYENMVHSYINKNRQMCQPWHYPLSYLQMSSWRSKTLYVINQIYKTLPWRLNLKKTVMFLTQYCISWYPSESIQQCRKSTCTGYSMSTKYILLLTAVVVDALHQVQGCLFLGGGSLIFFSQEGVVCAERDHHKAELPPYFCHPHRKHHRWHHNLTGKGGGGNITFT